MLLPVIDSTDKSMAFMIFEEVEEYLKESDWCYYRSNSGIIDILGNYKRLSSHLKNTEVLKLIGQKAKAGSLIKISLVSAVSGIEIEMTIIGDNGEDIYFSEKKSFSSVDTIQVAKIIKNWLTEYGRIIPYQGRIKGILGDQFSVDVGKLSGSFAGAKVVIKRPLKKKKHPLFKKVVEWETQTIARGKIIRAKRTHSQGKIEFYEGRKQIRLNDWAVLEKMKKRKREDKRFFKEKGHKFGKLGEGKNLFRFWRRIGKYFQKR